MTKIQEEICPTGPHMSAEEILSTLHQPIKYFATGDVVEETFTSQPALLNAQLTMLKEDKTAEKELKLMKAEHKAITLEGKRKVPITLPNSHITNMTAPVQPKKRKAEPMVIEAPIKRRRTSDDEDHTPTPPPSTPSPTSTPVPINPVATPAPVATSTPQAGTAPLPDSPAPISVPQSEAEGAKAQDTPPVAGPSTPSQWSQSNGNEDEDGNGKAEEETEDVPMQNADEDSDDYGDMGIDFSTADLSGCP